MLLEDAFYTNLYQRHAPALFAYAYRETGSHEDAEDIVLDVFLMVLRQPDFATFDEQKQVAWLWTITRHKVIDLFRKSARRQHISLEPFADTLYEEDERSPEHEHLKHEEYTQLHQAIKVLPEEQREVLRLRFGSSLRCTEIALVLDKSEGAVRMLLYRGIRTLRELYIGAGKESKTKQRKDRR